MNASSRSGVGSPPEGEGQAYPAGWVGSRPLGREGTLTASAGDSGAFGPAVPADRDDPRVVAALDAYLEALRGDDAGRATNSWRSMPRSPRGWGSASQCSTSSRRRVTSPRERGGRTRSRMSRSRPGLGSAITTSSARSDGGAWAWCMRPSRSPSGRRVALKILPLDGGDGSQEAPAVSDRGPGGRATAPPAHRADLRSGLRSGDPLLRHAVRRRPQPGSDHPRVAPGRGLPSVRICGRSREPRSRPIQRRARRRIARRPAPPRRSPTSPARSAGAMATDSRTSRPGHRLPPERSIRIVHSAVMSPGWASTRPMRWTMPMAWESCIATSSRRISSSIPAARSGSPISAWRDSPATSASRAPAMWSGRSAT